MFAREMRLYCKKCAVFAIVLAIAFAGMTLAFGWLAAQEPGVTFAQEIMDAFGMRGVASPSEWAIMALETAYLPLCAVLAALLGAEILLKEQSGGTLEEIGALPVSSTRIVLAHFFPGALLIGLMHAVVTGTLCGAIALQKQPCGEIVPVLAAMLLVLEAIYALCFALSIVTGRMGVMRTAALAIALGSWVLRWLGRMGDAMQAFGSISLFALCDAHGKLGFGAISAQQNCAGGLVIGLSLLFAVAIYDRKALV